MEETVSIARLFSNDKQTLWIKAVYLSIVFADISKKICHTIGSVFLHQNEKFISTILHHQSQIITNLKDNIKEKRIKSS